MAGVSRQARDEVIYHLGRARRHGLLTDDQHRDRVELAQMTTDPEVLTALTASVLPELARPAEAPGFRSPPSQPGPSLGEVTRLQRRARLARFGGRVGTELSSELLPRLQGIGGMLVGFVLSALLIGNADLPGLVLIALMLLIVVGCSVLTVRAFEPLNRRLAARAQRGGRHASLAALEAQLLRGSKPQDEYRSDSPPEGASPTPAPPRDAYSSDAPTDGQPR